MKEHIKCQFLDFDSYYACLCRDVEEVLNCASYTCKGQTPACTASAGGPKKYSCKLKSCHTEEKQRETAGQRERREKELMVL